MKIFLLILIGFVGLATAAPGSLENPTKLSQLPDHDKLAQSLATILKNENGEFNRLQELVQKASQQDILYIILEILHLLGYTDEEIIAFIPYMIEVVTLVEDQLTYIDYMKMTNAGVSIWISMGELYKFNWNVFLGDIYTLKKVIYPYVPEELQICLDNIEEIAIKLWRLFNDQRKTILT